MDATMIAAGIRAKLLAKDEDLDAFCAHYGIRLTQSCGGWTAEGVRTGCSFHTAVSREGAVYGLLDLLILR